MGYSNDNQNESEHEWRGFTINELLRGVWALTLSTANATRQTLSELNLLSLLWHFCAYLFVPQRRAMDYYE